MKGCQQQFDGGIDYIIKAQADVNISSWVALPDKAFTKPFRHDWVLKCNLRPKDPTVAHCRMPAEELIVEIGMRHSV